MLHIYQILWHCWRKPMVGKSKTVHILLPFCIVYYLHKLVASIYLQCMCNRAKPWSTWIRAAVYIIWRRGGSSEHWKFNETLQLEHFGSLVIVARVVSTRFMVNSTPGYQYSWQQRFNNPNPTKILNYAMQICRLWLTCALKAIYLQWAILNLQVQHNSFAE